MEGMADEGIQEVGRADYSRVVDRQAHKQQSENTLLKSPEVKRQFKSSTWRMSP